MKKFLVLAAFAATTIATSANAAISVTFPASPHLAGKNFTDFNDGTTGNLNLTGGSIIDPASGSSPNHAPPLGSDHQYYSTGPSDGTPSTLVLDKGAYFLSFLYGSIDSFNSITFVYADNSTVSYTGTQLNAFAGDPANGNQSSPATNKYIQFNLGNTGDQLRKVEFGSSTNAFEIDNLYVNAVPEPAAWALMIAGFGFVGGALRTRSRKLAATA
jgi:Tfp pilus assembly protein PilW